MESDAAMWSGIFVAIGVGTFLSSFVQSGSFGLMGAKLARRVRELSFGALLRQAGPPVVHPDAGHTALPCKPLLCNFTTGCNPPSVVCRLQLAERLNPDTLAPLQEAAWFDDESHSSGAMASRLATDAAAVRGAVGDQLGLLVQNLVTMVAGFAVAFAYGWKMTLVVLSVVPLMGAAGYFQVSVDGRMR